VESSLHAAIPAASRPVNATAPTSQLKDLKNTLGRHSAINATAPTGQKKGQKQL
jgi:hypothetical protein